jgi:hypothetical protein
MKKLIRMLYVSPANMMSLYGTGGGPVQATYLANWLCDGLPLHPVRSTSANPALSVANPARLCNFAACLNVNASPGTTVTVSGVGLTLTAPPHAGRVPFNPWAVLRDAGTGALLPPVSVASATFTYAGNTNNPLIVGEQVVGLALELERPVQPDSERGYERLYEMPHRLVDGQVRPRLPDKLARNFSGTTTVSTAGADAIVDWYESTEDGALMSVIVPDLDLPDAWAVKMDPPTLRRRGGNYAVSLSFREIARRRWP